MLCRFIARGLFLFLFYAVFLLLCGGCFLLPLIFEDRSMERSCCYEHPTNTTYCNIICVLLYQI